MSWDENSQKIHDMETRRYLDDVSEQRFKEMDRTNNSDGLGWFGTVVLIWAAPALIIHWLNFSVPFWFRCVIAIAAGWMTANYIGRRWTVAPVLRLIVFAIVAGTLFAVFRDEKGAGTIAFNLWTLLLGIAFWLLIALAAVGLVGGWIKGYFSTLRQNPVGVGLVTLVAVWFLRLVIANAPHQSPNIVPARTMTHQQHGTAASPGDARSAP
jgi:hypothetical protein